MSVKLNSIVCFQIIIIDGSTKKYSSCVNFYRKSIFIAVSNDLQYNFEAFFKVKQRPKFSYYYSERSYFLFDQQNLLWQALRQYILTWLKGFFTFFYTYIRRKYWIRENFRHLFIIAVVRSYVIFVYMGTILSPQGGKYPSRGRNFLPLVFSERTSQNTQN